MRTKKIVFFVLFCFLISSFAAVLADDFDDAKQIRWESVSEPFFNKYNPFGAGARAIGMGEAFAAIADDATAVYHNPAGLAQLDHNEIHWTGGSYYKAVPWTNNASFVMSLGGQYFGLSFMKLYHPIGRYPDKINIPAPIGPGGILFTSAPLTIGAGYYTNWYGSNGGLTAAEQEFLGRIYRTYINRPFQEDQVLLTYATPLTGDKSFMFGVNVKYQYTDADMKNFLSPLGTTPPGNGENYDAWAWALDVGFMYKLRIIEFLKDFNIGIMLRDVSGRMKRYKTGEEEPIYFTSTIAMSMRTTELIEKEITSLSIDWNAVNDPKVFMAERNRLRFGFEQWFLDSHFALRGGLVYFMYPGPWRMTLGISARYLLGLDYAYVMGLPFGSKAEEEGDSHWVSLYWQWGKVQKKLPTPEVFAAVEPFSFSPRNGEVAAFKLSASSPAGIDRWALNILDKNNNLVRTYVDIGMPPSQIIWNGSDSKYQLLPDAEYTFIFEATDKLGSTSSTPVQTVKIYTPVIDQPDTAALKKLKELLNAIKDRDVREDNAEMAKAKADVEALKKEKEKPTPVPPPGPATMPGFVAGAMPSPLTGTAGAPPSIVGFPNVDGGAVRSAYIETMPDGSRMFNMQYITENTLPQHALREMALMVRSISESMGYSVESVAINALYGGTNSLNLIVPSAQAQNLSRGLITPEQMLRGSSITLNGEAINPNF